MANAQLLMLTKSKGRAPETTSLIAAGLDLVEVQVSLQDFLDAPAEWLDAGALILEVGSGNTQDYEAFRTIVEMANGNLPVIAIVDNVTVADTRILLRSGALDVLPLPLSAEELKAVLAQWQPVGRSGHGAQIGGGRQGKLVAFVGTVGGVGSTSLATHMGIMWAGKSKVALLDLDLQFGNVALNLDLKPALHLGHLVENAERLDADLLESVALTHSSGLSLVASPTELLPIDFLTTGFVDTLLRRALEVYDIVLVDLPTVWTDWTARVLQRAHSILMVSNLSVAGLYQARRQLEVLDANGFMAKTQLVANRVEKGLFGKYDLKEPEAVLGRKIAFAIANDPQAVSAANDEGRSLRDVKSGSRVVKDLRAMAQSLEDMLTGSGDSA